MTDTMTDTRAAEVLAAHNEWRRYDGETGEPGAPAMGDPAEIGRAIDHVVSRFRAQPSTEAQPVPLDYVPGKLDHTAPPRIWLQIDTSAYNSERWQPWGGAEGVSWHHESIGGLEIQYVRADLASPPSAPVGVEGLVAKWERVAADDAYRASTLRGCIKQLRALAQQPAAVDGAAVRWAVERWNDEVANRPLVNVHRRTLDITWRQVIRHFGGDDVALCGPRHDDLAAQQGGRSDV